MLYEKKMLILSGSGKGVVLIEKSAAGAKFTLRTFDLPRRAVPFKAGVVTKTKVFVRDLPYRDNPSSVFTLELDSLDGLHFAVFDRELRLYGCIGKRMWEANLMDLLNKNDRRAPVTDSAPTALPPISAQPRVLPLPDGTGIPQSRLSVYGDDALADNDFYTKIDMSARMPVVDGFLDTSRVLDGLAPEIERQSREKEPALPPENEVAAIDGGATSESADGAENVNAEASISDGDTESADAEAPISENLSDGDVAPENDENAAEAPIGESAQDAYTVSESAENIDAESPAGESKPRGEDIYDSAVNVGSAPKGENPSDRNIAPERSVNVNAETPTSDILSDGGIMHEHSEKVNVETSTGENISDSAAAVDSAVEAQAEAEPQTDSVDAQAEFEPTFEAAATVAAQPWELTARWIKKRGGRELVVKKPRVRVVSAGEKLRHLRATEFFERARRDIDILFASARRDETLNGLIDDVEWVKVDVDGNTVSVGRSGNAFLCYAVSGTYERTPPLGEEAQWLPRDKTAPTGKGYWVIFQNLSTGEIIK